MHSYGCSDASGYATRLTGCVTANDTHLRALEAESIHIMREVVAEFERPVMLYSIGKDSSVLLRLAQKAFYPGPIPFPLLHIDTTYKFREMIEFRDRYTAEIGARLIVHTNTEAIADGTQPFLVGTQGVLRRAQDQVAARRARRPGGFDAAFGGARRDEERSRAKERIFSLRDANGQWDPKNQRPELWQLLNSRIRPGESIRVFPLSNWTEIDVWSYIHLENIPVVPLYFAKEREVVVRGESLITLEQPFVPLLPGERPQRIMCRMRSLGCSPCTGAVRSTADTVPKIIEELIATQELGAAAAHHRPRSGRVDGAQEARGLLLMSGLLRICTAGSVDDGKSTLIGRLLYDSRSVYEDQVHSVEKASKNRTAGPIDFSLFTDGLRAEREQGITIDVAYRYFATARRKFILADTPGHEQYTRNMATGASTADVAILLVDARNGVRAQSRRHAQIARLLGINDYVLAVNKMDLVDFDRDVFEDISDEFEKILPGANVHPIPISALHGDNVITRSERTPWFDGMALLEFLETVAGRSQRGRQAVPLPGAARAPAQPRLPRLRRPDCVRLGPPRRRRDGVAVRPGDARQADRHLGRRPRRGARRHVGDADARGRDRHQPRRHAGERVGGRVVGESEHRSAVPRRRRLDGRAAARSGARLPV